MIAVSIQPDAAGDLDRCMRAAEAAAAEGAGLIEWRLDALAPDVPADLTSRSPRPAILTARSVEEGGACELDGDALADWVDAASALDPPPAWIDVEYTRWLQWEAVRDAVDRAQAAGRRVLCSFHDTIERPADLRRLAVDMQAGPFDAVKIVWRARSLRDCLECRELLATRAKPMIAICMGPCGILSRVMGCAWGGLLTFASVDAASETAPGQLSVAEMVGRYRVPELGATTRVFGLIGDPIGASPGFALHNQAFASIGFDGVYLPLPVAEGWESLKATLGVMVADEGLHFGGASITLPHKLNALRFVRDSGGEVGEDAARCGAVNTLQVNADGTIRGDNTDIAGILEPLRSLGAVFEGACVAVLGAGGVARAAASAVMAEGAAVHIFNRSGQRAATLVEDLASHGTIQVGGRGPFDIVVQATSLGMRHGDQADACVLEALGLGASDMVQDGGLAVETVYDPENTPFVVAMSAAGCSVVTGRDMWLAQGSAQQNIWTGYRPSSDIWVL